MQKPFVSVFDRIHDVVVFGAGYAGYAAAVRLAGEGKSVLLSDLTGGLLWESGRAFFADPGPASAGFDFFTGVTARISGIAEAWVDGGTAEFTANELARDSRLPRLYFVAPVAVEKNDDSISAVIVATKSGLRRLVARQWIDATETGTLARLAGLAAPPRAAERRVLRLMFQKRRWTCPGRVLPDPKGLAAGLSWQTSGWSAERVLQIDLPGGEGRFLHAVVPALEALRRELGPELDESFVSHASYEPFPVYGPGPAGASPAANLALAVPGCSDAPVRTLGDRYRLGHEAAGALASRPALATRRIPNRPPRLTQASSALPDADVVVSGLGTGGAFAALAAARAGARVAAFDPMPFAGGIGVGGGIPTYYWGAWGGLQNEVDERVRAVMPLFGGRDCWPKGFHPDAKRIVLEGVLHEAGVQVRTGCLLARVERRGRRVKAAWMAAPDGPVRIEAPAWIDATGDGDLCTMAGAETRFGRAGDGLPQACTQSCGHFNLEENRVVGRIVNLDSDIADPVDPEDATRSRSEGLHLINETVKNAFNRITHAVPMLGIRQGRQIRTDYELTLADLLDRRRFKDGVGVAGCHYDNHASDYEFESLDAFFYVNCAGLWRFTTASEFPYRMLLPRKLANVWIACRAAGLSEEAVHSFRMQRDIQRIGEVCGLAAAFACPGGDSRKVPHVMLRMALEAGGALPLGTPPTHDFGRSIGPAEMEPVSPVPESLALWNRYRGARTATPELKQDLKAKSDSVRWQAAMVLGAWGEASAEPRLLQALAEREVGREAELDKLHPEKGGRGILPRWWIAVTLLRQCGTVRCLPTLLALAGSPDLPFRLKTALALALAGLASRSKPVRLHNPKVGEALVRLEQSVPDLTGKGWQAAYAVARARKAWRIRQGPSFKVMAADSRSLVRRAFQELA